MEHREISADLVQLQTEFTLVDVHLKHIVTDWKTTSFTRLCHGVKILWIPASYDGIMAMGSARISSTTHCSWSTLHHPSRPLTPHFTVNPWQLTVLIAYSSSVRMFSMNSSLVNSGSLLLSLSL